MTHRVLRPPHGVDLDLRQAKITSQAHRRAMLPLIYHLSSPCAAWNCFPATTLNPACSVMMDSELYFGLGDPCAHLDPDNAPRSAATPDCASTIIRLCRLSATQVLATPV